MNTRVEDGVVQVLRTALKKIDEEREALNRIAEEKRREFDEYVTRQHEALDRRQQALGTALQAMILDEETLSNHEDGNGPRLAISDANLNVIRDYLDAHDGEVRQQDVVNDTGLNSGVVSVGLRRLMLDGEIERGYKDRGSQVWKVRQPIMAGGSGEVVSVKPGIGVSTAKRI
jgi:exonuclease VII large subunit